MGHEIGTAPAGPAKRALSSDLTKLCLPREFHDANRKPAWVNSICLLFLVVGVAGLKSPRPTERPVNKSQQVVSAVLVPAKPPPKLRAQVAEAPARLSPLPDASWEPPTVTAVAAVDASAVAFAVPVAAPAALVTARQAAPRPATSQVAAKDAPAPTAKPYVPSEADWGGHKLEYPALAKRRGYQGKVVLEILVAPDGRVASVKVRESSGHQILDDAAREHVERHLRLRQPPGETRLHTLDIVYQL